MEIFFDSQEYINRSLAIKARMENRRRLNCLAYLQRTRNSEFASVKILRQQCKAYLASLRPLSDKQTALVEHMTEVDKWGKWWLP